eukprot:TRINITY_DN24_c0_g1_i6.p3 TRINITY_DN24_c0_g1~~TRINITY_DN24_c0_g1_i6.p3  ORF type:complete len:257 (+),score=-59.42 TRINITY_DN24_c0_g1_i6:2279-3049(+)
MDRSSGFGSTPSNQIALIRLAFAAPPLFGQACYQTQVADPLYKRYAVTPQGGSHCLYACGFRFYFTPLPGFFSPFPHGTGSLSVDHEYLALEDGPPIFRQDYTCPALLVARLVPLTEFRLQGYHLLWPGFPSRLTIPSAKTRWLFRFRSPLLSESRLISFPRATEMFQFTRFASTDLCIQSGIPPCGSGFPHSDIYGSKLVCQLPVAFRRLPRPSSPVIAKASTICTQSLDPPCTCLLYTSPSPRDQRGSRMPSSA